MSEASTVDELLDLADTERLAGRAAQAAALYDDVIGRSREAGDLVTWTRAALGAASVHVFGTEPGKLPAQLYDLLVRIADDADHARVAAALARCWVYAGHPARAVEFADDAIARAELSGRADVLADCLDAGLAAHWGPDDLAARVTMAARLDAVAAHVLEPQARLQAQLWGLQVACESLDLPSIHRHMRALELLADESPTAAFFAATRRLMLDLLRGRTDTAAYLIEQAEQAAALAGLADSWMVVESAKGYTGVFSGDRTAAARVAEQCEAFFVSEGAAPVGAEGAFLWLGAGEVDRAREIVRTFAAPALAELPRDVSWLLTLQCVLEAALAVADREVVADARALLAPYEGRAVINAGAVMFHGLVDDTLSRAAEMFGEDAEAQRLRERALATYERLGARWWRDRLRDSATAIAAGMCFHPSNDGLWLVGPAAAPTTVRALRGYDYLHVLVSRPGDLVPALELVADGGEVVAQPGLGEMLDSQAREAYRRRLIDLDDEISDAEVCADAGRLEVARAEREALIDELAAATGLGGRSRTAAGSSQERARVAVTKAINAAIKRLAAVDSTLGEHLRTSIQTGSECSYQPRAGAEISWVLS